MNKDRRKRLEALSGRLEDVRTELQDIIDEIEEINCENVYFIDDDFLLNVPRLKKFIQLIKEKNIRKK